MEKYYIGAKIKMLKNYEKELLEKLSPIKEIDDSIYIYLLSKIDFYISSRIKRNILRIVRSSLTNEFNEIFKEKSLKKIIDIINQPTSKKKILYIGLEPTFNIVRESIYLRKKGYETIALIESSWAINFIKKHFDHVLFFKSRYLLCYILSRVKPYLIHVQGAAARSDYFGILSKLLSPSKLIFEFYDVRSLCQKREDAISFEAEKDVKLSFFSEKFAFENSDGLILSYSSEIFSILKEKYKITAPILEFHQYTCEEFIAKNEKAKLSKRDNKIHLVFGGLVAPLRLPKKLFGDIQFQDLIDILSKQDIFFHVYLSPHLSLRTIWELFSEYHKISSKNALFSIKRGIPPDRAPEEFSMYDFGVMFYLFEKGTCLKEHLSTRLPGKIFTYLEAGLPIIVSEELEYVADIVRKYEIGIVVSKDDINNLSEIINKYDYNKLRNNVKIAREELSMEKHIDRLITLYEKITDNKTGC